MKRLTRWLAIAAKRQDIVLAVMLLVAVFMMIVPLPTALVDLLIAINLTISIVLLMMSLYIREPLEFSAFPSVLLITTLYRLALTISTTRLILLQADAGEIVYTFGSFAVGGNLAVGIIVFSIITIVQFIVITKGSERVAEVGARFSLDGMPGKQMSIDGDMRAASSMRTKRGASAGWCEGKPVIRRDGRRNEVRQGRRYRGHHHHPREHRRRHCDRRVHARHECDESDVHLCNPFDRRWAHQSDSRAADLRSQPEIVVTRFPASSAEISPPTSPNKWAGNLRHCCLPHASCSFSR